MNWLDALQRHRLDNRACMVVMIIEVQGSAPRPVGTRMVVTHSGFDDTLGGGALEMEAISHARALLQDAGNRAAVHSRTLVLGAELNQCCGGKVTLQFDYHPANDFIIHVFGAGHVAQEVARMVLRLPCVATFHDSRETWLRRLSDCLTERRSCDEVPTAAAGRVSNDVADVPAVPAARISDTSRAVFTAQLAGAIAGASVRLQWLPENAHGVVEDCAPGAFYLVMTHSHERDLELVEAIVSRGDAAYCGLIASRSKAARFRSRLSRKGFSRDELAVLVAPIGRGRMSADTPMEVAVAAVSDILQERERIGSRMKVTGSLP